MVSELERAAGMIGKTVRVADGTLRVLEVQVRKTGIRLVGSSGESGLCHVALSDVIVDTVRTRKEVIAGLMSAVDGMLLFLENPQIEAALQFDHSRFSKFMSLRDDLAKAYIGVKGVKG